MSRKIQVKAFQPTDFDLKEDGAVRVAFATLNVEDEDGHITLPGAIPTKSVAMSDYSHSSWPQKGGRLPVGKGSIREDGDLGLFEGSFFLKTDQGRNAYETVKGMGEIQEWSYGYEILKGIEMPSPEDPKRKALGLAELDIHEVSPVLLGAAGRGRSMTLGIKAAAQNASEASWMISSLMRLIEQQGLAGEDGSENTDVAALRIALSAMIDWMGEQADLVGSEEDLARAALERKRLGMLAEEKVADLVLKALPSDRSGILLAGIPLGEMSDRLLAANTAWKERLESLLALRVKEGRVLSTVNRDRLRSVTEALSQVEEIRKGLLDLLEETDPEKKQRQGQVLLAEYLRNEARILGVEVQPA